MSTLPPAATSMFDQLRAIARDSIDGMVDEFRTQLAAGDDVNEVTNSFVRGALETGLVDNTAAAFLIAGAIERLARGDQP